MGNKPRLRLLAPSEVLDEHLLDRFVVGPQHVANTVSAHQMADFFGKVLGVVAATLQRLGHEQNVEALLAGSIVMVVEVAQEDEIAQTVELGVGAQYRQSEVQVAAA